MDNSTLLTISEFIKDLYPEKEIIALHEPVFRGNERKYVLDAIDSTFVSSVGKYVNRFEEMMCEITGAKYAVATVNGTAALHIALLTAGVKKSDLVITQSLSFIATCNAIRYVGADPVFVDIDINTLGLSAEKLESFLVNNVAVRSDGCYHKESGRRIAACVPMHTFGHPVEIDKIKQICQEFQIKLIEDAAESIGSSFKGQQTGTFGLVSTFSFNGNKTVTAGGGGVVITDDETIAKKAKHLTTQAKLPHRWEFAHDEIGYNYRMPNLNAALACAQLELLTEFIELKRNLTDKYTKFFESLDIQFFREKENAKSNYWLNAIILDNKEERDQFLTFTNNRNILTRPVWDLMNTLPMFKDCISDDLTNSIYVADRIVNLPSGINENG